MSGEKVCHQDSDNSKILAKKYRAKKNSFLSSHLSRKPEFHDSNLRSLHFPAFLRETIKWVSFFLGTRACDRWDIDYRRVRNQTWKIILHCPEGKDRDDDQTLPRSVEYVFCCPQEFFLRAPHSSSSPLSCPKNDDGSPLLDCYLFLLSKLNSSAFFPLFPFPPTIIYRGN